MRTFTTVAALAALASIGTGAARSTAGAEVVVAPVEADTYILHSHGINNGYPDCHVARVTSYVAAEAFFRFDLSELEEAEICAEQILGATFYVFPGEGEGSMATPVAPAGTTQEAQITALRTWDPAAHPYGFEYWTEAGLGAYSAGYFGGEQIGPNMYDPGDVGGVDPYEYAGSGRAEIEGDLDVTLSHNTGPNTWASADLTDFVKAWLEGGEQDIPNNGIRIHDLGTDNWGWYLFSKDIGGTGAYGLPAHPGASYVPYLEVEYDPNWSPEPLAGDLNGDGAVDSADLDIIRANWGLAVPPADPRADPSADGSVGSGDLDIVRANWGATASSGSNALTGTLQTVPEPGIAAMLLGILSPGFFRRRGSV